VDVAVYRIHQRIHMRANQPGEFAQGVDAVGIDIEKVTPLFKAKPHAGSFLLFCLTGRDIVRQITILTRRIIVVPMKSVSRCRHDDGAGG
jgi:hypothetical protein